MLRGGMQISVAARFEGPAQLHAITLAAELAIPPGGGRASVWIADAAGRAWRHGHIAGAFAGAAPLVLAFPAFADPYSSTYHLFITESVEAPPEFFPELRDRIPLPGEPMAILAAESAVPLPPLPPNGVFLIDDGRIVPANRVPAAITVTTDIGAYWRDQFGAYLNGWAHCTRIPIERLFLVLGDNEAELELIPFPDVIKHYPECGDVIPVRWSGYVAGPPGEPLRLRIETPVGQRTVAVRLPERLTRLPEPDLRGPALHMRFVREVNERRLRVLEIGGRLVSPGAIDWRQMMHGASGYIGFDVHPAPTVDVVGDAHLLTSYFAPGSLDAVWSAVVFEHLRQPWLVAAEINRVLRMDGLVLTQAPVHEAPADYWRYSDEGLKVLFGPEFGFEVIDSVLAEPIVLVPRCRDRPFYDMPLHPGYGQAVVLARKVAELPAATGLEAMQRALIGESGKLYPASDRERLAYVRGG
jgi:hypothetical protein